MSNWHLINKNDYLKYLYFIAKISVGCEHCHKQPLRQNHAIDTRIFFKIWVLVHDVTYYGSK